MLLSPLGALVAASIALLLAGQQAGGYLAAALAVGLLIGTWIEGRRRTRSSETLRARIDRLQLGVSIDDLERPTGIGELDAIATSVAKLHQVANDRIDILNQLVAARGILLNSIGDPIIAVDERCRIVQENMAAQRLFGSPLPGRDLAAVVRHPGVLDGCEQILRGGSARVVDLMVTDPVERDFRVAIHPLPPRSPDNARIALTFHDVTALMRAERMRGDFIANASHELRTPLASLLGFIETLRGPARDDREARERFLAIMDEQAQRMSRLVNDLLSLSRIEQHEHLPPTERVGLAEVLESVTASFQLQAARRKMRVVLSVDPTLPIVLGDRDELQQLFQNLVDNAVKYGRDGGRVEVSAQIAAKIPAALPRTLHGAIAVSIRDEGEGIAREHLPRLTERFYRVNTGRSRAVGGTGLGLAIVKHIVGRHRGALTIESEAGRGSVFTVYLPAQAREPQEVAASARAS